LEISQLKEIAWYELGDNLYKSGDNEGALFAFQKSIDENPNYYLSYVSKAIVFAAIENYTNAIENIDKAIALQQKIAEYWLFKSQYLCEADREDEALLILQYVAKEFPLESEPGFIFPNFYVTMVYIEIAKPF
jgi:tetratricopeptide (TPR) repeat protein